MPRAPFIWTVRQPIDPEGFFSAIRGLPPRSDGLNRWFMFRRKVELAFAPERASLNITCDGKYQLFVNGERIGRGPPRCSPLRQLYDRYEGVKLKQGANTIGVLVHTYGLDTAFYEGVHGHWRAAFGDGALWLDGSVEATSRAQAIQTDLQWRVRECAAWRQDTPQVNSGLGFVEVFDANLFPRDWLEDDFDDAAWDDVQVLVAGGGGPEARFGGVVTRPFPILKPADTAQMVEHLHRPARLVWTRDVTETADLPLERQAYEEALGPPRSDDNLLQALSSGDAVAIGVRANLGTALLFDFGDIFAGRPRLAFEAVGGEAIDIVVSEHILGEYDPNGVAADARLARNPILGMDAHVSRVIARPGFQVFEAFERDAVRWLQVTVRGAGERFRLRDVGVVATRHPGQARGRFECSDPLLTRLWALGRKTLELCMHDGWIDCPSREQRQWLGDATVEHLVGEAVFGADIHGLNRHFLRSAADSQRTDGLMEMFAPGDHRRFGWLIPDYSLHWIFNAWDHYQHSGDIELARELFPTLLKALAWFEALQGPDGRIADLPYWHFQDWAAVGRTGFATVLHAELCGAFEIGAQFASALGWADEHARLAGRAERLRAALEAHWDEERGVYVDSVDPATGRREARVSQHSNAAMILWGAIPAERARAIAAVIGDRTRLKLTPAPPIIVKGEPFDISRDIVLANTFFSHFVYAAFAKAGRFDLALDLMRERYGAMVARGATTLWEGFEPHASLAHGFSATPTWQFARNILGVSPAAPGFASVRVTPFLGDLEFANGVVPSKRGDIEVAMKRDGGAIRVDVTLPANVSGVLECREGYALEGEAALDPGKNARLLVRPAAAMTKRHEDAPE